MFIDVLLRVSDAQALTATAVSEDSIDLGDVTPKRKVGTGEPMGFGLAVDVALAGTTPTFNVEVISATNGALTAGIIVHAQYTKTQAEMIAGALFFLAIPQGTPTQRFVGLRYNLGGTTPTVTVTSWLTAHDLFSIAAESYAKGYVIS
jgi:hypothetical protein